MCLSIVHQIVLSYFCHVRVSHIVLDSLLENTDFTHLGICHSLAKYSIICIVISLEKNLSCRNNNKGNKCVEVLFSCCLLFPIFFREN